MDHKFCTNCNCRLELTTKNFSQTKHTKKSGAVSIYWSSYCIKCQHKKAGEWARNHKEKIKEHKKKYIETHVNEEKIRRSNYRKKNKDKISQYNKNYRIEHKEILREQDKNRRQNNPAARLRTIIRGVISRAIHKNSSMTKFLPYSFKKLKEHLESKFEFWMNWNNYGKYDSKGWDDNNSDTWTWQIDHIIPHSKFNYKSMEDEDFKKCWDLSNLRPYSAKQNVIDGALRIRH